MDTTGLVPLADAARRLGGRSKRTLKRWYVKGLLPVVITDTTWEVPESFLIMVEASPRPARAGRLDDIAKRWFAEHATDPADEAAA